MSINLGVSFIISLLIVVFSHLTVDKEIPANLKIGAWIFFIVLGIGYVLFGIIL